MFNFTFLQLKIKIKSIISVSSIFISTTTNKLVRFSSHLLSGLSLLSNTCSSELKRLSTSLRQYARQYRISAVTFSTIFLLLVFLFNHFNLLIITLLLGFIIFFFVLLSYKYLSFLTSGKIFIFYWFVLVNFSLLNVFSPSVNLLDQGAGLNQLLLSTTTSIMYFYDNQILLGSNVYVPYYTLTVSIISFFANYHTLTYMKSDQKKEKFIVLLNAFAFSMILLVFTKNILILLLSWELLGITSFFLINHNDTQTNSLRSALKALTFNKVSDILFLVSVIIFFCLTRSLNVSDEVLKTLIVQQNTELHVFKKITINVFLVLIFLGASVKSVQFFFYMWLPDSMKAPVPASALIHSATLVAAGFYVILIFKNIFFFYWGHLFFAVIGLLTACLGALIAAYQSDLKKILAYSTIANCGFMLALLSMYDERVFLCYFVAHGIFKSCCFMYSGEIILLQQHSQDTRTYFNQLSHMRKSTKGVLVSILSLAGIPVTITFSIKHMLLLVPSSPFQLYCLDSFFNFYSFLSFCYALNFIIRVFFFNFNSKEYENEHADTHFYSNYLLNSVYIVLSVLITYGLHISIKNYIHYTQGNCPNWQQFSLHILFGLFLFICLAMLTVYANCLDIQNNQSEFMASSALLYSYCMTFLFILKTWYEFTKFFF